MIVEQTITQKLQEALSPQHLEVINESSSHNVPANSETHFKVIAVSEVFSGVRAVARQQKIYGLLNDELAGGVHALSMQLFTPEEWAADSRVKQSPPCLGGSS